MSIDGHHGIVEQGILVGYDDSHASMAAARWAADLARSTRAELRLVHAWNWPLLRQAATGIPLIDPAGPRNQAMRVLDDAAEGLAEAFPEVTVTGELRPGTAQEVLEDLSARVGLLVVGTRGLGAVMGALLGSVSRGILHDAGCPVAVIRSDQHRAGPVLVGYDGSEAAGRAVDEAMDLAAAWGSMVRVVHVRSRAHAPYTSSAEAWSTTGGSHDVLEKGVARAAARQEGVVVQSRMVEHRSVAEGLLEAATGARLLVLGHRGLSRGAFGSTAQAVVLHATGNVVVVRQPLQE